MFSGELFDPDVHPVHIINGILNTPRLIGVDFDLTQVYDYGELGRKQGARENKEAQEMHSRVKDNLRAMNRAGCVEKVGRRKGMNSGTGRPIIFQIPQDPRTIEIGSNEVLPQVCLTCPLVSWCAVAGQIATGQVQTALDNELIKDFSDAGYKSTLKGLLLSLAKMRFASEVIKRMPDEEVGNHELEELFLDSPDKALLTGLRILSEDLLKDLGLKI